MTDHVWRQSQCETRQTILQEDWLELTPKDV